MTKFNLANDWFGPDSTLYRKANNPHDFDDELIPLLPSKTTYVEGDNAGKRVGEVRGDKEPVPGVSLEDYARLKLENERLLEALSNKKPDKASVEREKAAEKAEADKVEPPTGTTAKKG